MFIPILGAWALLIAIPAVGAVMAGLGVGLTPSVPVPEWLGKGFGVLVELTLMGLGIHYIYFRREWAEYTDEQVRRHPWKRLWLPYRPNQPSARLFAVIGVEAVAIGVVFMVASLLFL